MKNAGLSILADENIPFVKQAFAGIGAVHTMPGRTMKNSDVRQHDVLLVRSVTEVNEALLSGSRVRFVGTATIGTDHVDEAYLKSRGIAFASAPGSNAQSVAEYITAALLELCAAHILSPPNVSVAVVGVGNVGSRVAAKVNALGFKTLLNDPPLKDQTGDDKYRPLDEVLPLADVVSVHVPLNESGPYPTLRMINEDFVTRMKRGAVLINSSRGDVADEGVIRNALGTGRLAAAVLDVWNNEPDISMDTLGCAFLGTPHIAGYSFDGKVRGTEMLYTALCRFLGRLPEWKMSDVLPPPVIPEVIVRDSPDVYESVREVVRAVYNIREDDGRLKMSTVISPAYRGVYFDYLRKTYPVRREFYNTHLVGDTSCQAAGMLKALGFEI